MIINCKYLKHPETLILIDQFQLINFTKNRKILLNSFIYYYYYFYNYCFLIEMSSPAKRYRPEYITINADYSVLNTKERDRCPANSLAEYLSTSILKHEGVKKALVVSSIS